MVGSCKNDICLFLEKIEFVQTKYSKSGISSVSYIIVSQGWSNCIYSLEEIL